MAAADTVEALVKLGVLIKDTASRKGVDWPTFLKSPDYATISQSVEQLTQNLSRNAFQEAIAAIDQKQQVLLVPSGNIADLSTEKLLQYSDLGNLKLKLTAKNADSSNLGTFGEWLAGDALPVLLQVAPVVLPLLL
jgi:hypothetical protein